MKMDERLWERLLADIRGRQVIPVIGSELLTVEAGGRTVPLYQHLARQLVERLELDASGLPEEYGFFQAVGAFLEQQPSHPRRYDQDEIYYEIRQIMEEHVWTTPPSLLRLAEITDFDLFVTSTFDSLMEQALEQVRHRRPESYAYCKREKVVDLPDDFQPEDRPTVFHFFGKLNSMNDFAVTDEDILQYAHRLQSRDLRPHNLFDQFRHKRLLTLGCSFPGWLTRFFLAAAKGDELFTVGAPGVLADDLSGTDLELVGFLGRNKINVYTEGGAADFVTELHRRWTERFGGAGGAAEPPSGEPLPAEMEPDSVFISFRREDRDTARSIAERFRREGIDTWFDETDLEPGDNYKLKIANHISRCFAFVPLISRHSIAYDARPWFYRYEWHVARDAVKFRPENFPFFLPVIVDDTDPADPLIPEAFRASQVTRLAALDGLIAKTRERIRNFRREGRLA